MADTSPVFRAVIAAVDKASAVLDRIGGRSRALGSEFERLGNPWGSAAERVSVFTRATNAVHAATHRLADIGAPFVHARHRVHDLTESVHKLGERFAGLGEKVSEIFPMLAAFGAGGSVAGLFELTHKVADASGEFMRSAVKLGMTTSELMRLNYAAKMTETPLESMQLGVGKLSKAIGAAASGKNRDVAALFAHLHIPLRDANGQMVRAVDVLPRLQEAFRETTDVTMRQRMAFALFGRSGLEMLPMLMSSQEKMDKWGETAKRLTYPFTPADREHLEEFRHSWVGLETATTGVGNALGAKLAPILTPVVEKFIEWVSVNRDWIATGIADKVGKLADWVMRLDFDRVVEGTKAWLEPIGEVVDRIGGLKVVIFGTAAMMARPWVAAAGAMVRTLGEIVLAAGNAAWALGVAMVESLGRLENAMASFNRVAARSPVVRVAMIAMEAHDLATDWHTQVTQKQLDADPEKATDNGFFKSKEGKWEYNGREQPSGEAPKPDWFEKFSAGVRSRMWGETPPPGVGEKPPPSDDGNHDGTVQPGAIPHGAVPPGGAMGLPPFAGYQPPVGAMGMPQFAGYQPPGMGGIGVAAPNPLPVFDQLQTVMSSNRDGKVDVKVTFENVPPGTAASATGSGVTSDPKTDIGYAFPGMMPAY